MAIYHLSAKVISRAGGRSSVGAAAYRSGSVLVNERDGQVHDYSRKRHVEHTEILAPDNVPDWMRDRSQLWNAVEVAEKRKDAQLAREIEIALPRELDRDEQRDLVRAFAREQFVDRGMIADIALHNPKASDGQDQPHAHVMLTMRELTGDGFGKKNRDWNDRDQLGDWRAAWERHANLALERHGHESRIDHRTLDAQREAARERGDQSRADALDREPQPKIGMAASGMERRGRDSERGDDWRASQARNAERQTLRDQLREIGERISETMREMGGQVRGAATSFRDRLNQAAARVLGRERTGDRERDDRPEPVSAAERIAQRLRAAEPERNDDMPQAREAPAPERDAPQAGSSLRDRLNQAAEQALARGERRDAERADLGGSGSATSRVEDQLRSGAQDREAGRERDAAQGSGSTAEDRIMERLRQRFEEQTDQVRERVREREPERTRDRDRGHER